MTTALLPPGAATARVSVTSTALSLRAVSAFAESRGSCAVRDSADAKIRARMLAARVLMGIEDTFANVVISCVNHAAVVDGSATATGRGRADGRARLAHRARGAGPVRAGSPGSPAAPAWRR